MSSHCRLAIVGDDDPSTLRYDAAKARYAAVTIKVGGYPLEVLYTREVNPVVPPGYLSKPADDGCGWFLFFQS